MVYGIQYNMFVWDKNDEQFEITDVQSIEVKKSVKNIENSASVVISKDAKRIQDDIAYPLFLNLTHYSELIQEGNYVLIYARYYNLEEDKDNVDNQFKEDIFNTKDRFKIFEGFINTIITSEENATLELLDITYILKKIKVTIPQKKKQRLDSVLTILQDEINKYLKTNYTLSLEYEIVDEEGILKTFKENNIVSECIINTIYASFELENFGVKNISVLDTIKIFNDTLLMATFVDEDNNINIGYNLDSRFYNRDKIIDSCEVFTLDASQQSYVSNLILDSTNLKYQSKDGSKIGLKVVGINPRNSTKREVEIGDKEGDIKTYVIYGSHSERELKRLGSQYLAQFKYSGFEDGSYFTTFGEPFIKLLQPVGFTQLIYKNNYEVIGVVLEALDVYQCTGINHIYSESGFRQQIYLGIKLSNDVSEDELIPRRLSERYPNLYLAPPLSAPKNIIGTDIPKDEGAIDIGASKVDDYSPLDALDIDFDRDFL